MSEGGFHVHGAHEHAVEHAAQHSPLGQAVALFTALLSTCGAIVSYQGSLAQNEALLYKNEAVLKQTQAADQWNFYEAKSSKGHLMEMAADLAPTRSAYYRARAARYAQDKLKIRTRAEALEHEFKAANAESARYMRPHYRLAQAITLIQIAISLASITALTRRRWLLGLAGVAAVGAGVLWLTAFLGS
ncbi:MAG TPA: DUF4337 domain-containing protein [Acidiferrobacteraceae bacterium]|nr:DUF4337 domain-containing protein [Acidiferrobacteraceae bacterium]